MAKHKRSNKTRTGCNPNPMMTPCGESSPRKYADVVGGFDSYGYPVVRRFNMPRGYAKSAPRSYGQASGMIAPMKLAAREPGQPPPPPKVAIAQLEDFKLKVAPTVPAAPDDLPPKFKFCVQKGESGYFLRFRDSNTSLHGAAVEIGECQPDEETGILVCPVQREGFQAWGPICEDPAADKEPLDVNCCVLRKGDESGQLVCPGSAYDLLVVQVLPGTEHEVEGVQHVSVQHPDLPGGGARLAVCEPVGEVPEDRPCCIEEGTGLIVCPDGISFPLDGQKIPLEYLEFVTGGNGTRVARLRCGDIMNIPPSHRAEDPSLDAMYNICEELGGYIFPVCEKEKKYLSPAPVPKAPPKLPDVCCFDVPTNTLVCEGTELHGLEVVVNALGPVGNREMASVSHPNIPGGTIRVPICPRPADIPRLPPADCCVIESSAGLMLQCAPADHPWNGRDVTTSGKCVDLPQGRLCVLKWSDEHGDHTLELPVCSPPPTKIPPPDSGDVPRAPDSIPIPVPPPPRLPTPVPVDVPRAPESIPIPMPPPPRLPPPTPPTDGRETPEANGCRDRWEEMVTRPAKAAKCDKKWLKLLRDLRSGAKCPTMGRRYSGMKHPRPRKYAMGIPAEAREYGRYPGLRGGRRIA